MAATTSSVPDALRSHRNGTTPGRQAHGVVPQVNPDSAEIAAVRVCPWNGPDGPVRPVDLPAVRMLALRLWVCGEEVPDDLRYRGDLLRRPTMTDAIDLVELHGHAGSAGAIGDVSQNPILLRSLLTDAVSAPWGAGADRRSGDPETEREQLRQHPHQERVGDKPGAIEDNSPAEPGPHEEDRRNSQHLADGSWTTTRATDPDDSGRHSVHTNWAQSSPGRYRSKSSRARAFRRRSRWSRNGSVTSAGRDSRMESLGP